MGGLIVKLRTWWETADRTQRTVSTVGGGFLLLLIIGTYIFASKPHMGVLASGLSPSEQGTIVDALQKEGVVTELGPSGDVLVPDNRITDLRAKLALQGKLPANGHTTADDDLKNISFTSTPSVERERLKAIEEARIENSIESLDNIQSAQVHIALGSDSAFANEKKSATASVTLAEKPGSIITPDEAHGIASLVANSVSGLDLNSVTVLNRAGQALVDPSEAGSARGKVASQLETQSAEAKKRERDIQQKLDTVFGAGNTIASVDLQLDFDSKSYTSTVNKATPPVVSSEQKETMNGSGAGAAPGGVAGARANQVGAPGAIGTGGSSDSQYANSQKVYVPLVNTTITNGDNNAGQIKSMAISVVVAKDKVKPEVVQNILKGYLGPHTADPTNFTATVTESDFDTTAAKLAATSVGASASRDRMQQIFSLLPVGALFVVGFMVMKALGKLPQPMMLATNGGMLSIPGRGLDMDAATAAKFGITDGGGNRGAQALGTGAQGSGTGITFSNDGAGGGMRAAPGSILEDPDIEIESIKRRVNVPLEQIKRMSEEKPEVVAMLIKSWLMEERG